MSDTKLYAQRDHVAQGEHFIRHLSAMTGAGLHAKSAIAAELAHRDITIARLEAERDAAREVLHAERLMHEARVTYAVKLLTGIHSLLYPPPMTLADGRTLVFRPQSPDPHEVLQELSDRIRALPDELEKMPVLDYEAAAIRAAMEKP